MAISERDPKDDPRAGDCIHRAGSRGPVCRYVVMRRGNEVYYRSVLGGDVKKCWLTTWMDWARGADLGDSPGDPLAVPHHGVTPPTDPVLPVLRQDYATVRSRPRR